MKMKSLFTLLIFCFLLTSCGRKLRQPELFLVPDGYVGWIQVDYEVQGAPELPIQNEYRVCKFTRSGKIKTSSPFLEGVAKDKAYYVTAKGWKELADTSWGGGGMLWGGSTSGPTLKMFVGTEKQYNNLN